MPSAGGEKKNEKIYEQEFGVKENLQKQPEGGKKGRGGNAKD